MKNLLYTDILLVVSLILLFLGMVKISNLESENRVMKKEIFHKDSIIVEYKNEVDSFEDILQEREMEVRYWGMKYDSIKQIKK
jgi:hypothetical protein